MFACVLGPSYVCDVCVVYCIVCSEYCACFVCRCGVLAISSSLCRVCGVCGMGV